MAEISMAMLSEMSLVVHRLLDGISEVLHATGFVIFIRSGNKEVP